MIHTWLINLTGNLLNIAPALIFVTYPFTQTIMYLNRRDRERAKIHN